MALDEKMKRELKKLGSAINEAISSADAVHDVLKKIRSMGFDPYLVLDATVAFDRCANSKDKATLPSIRRGKAPSLDKDGESIVFQIDMKDLKFLQSVGIDPTRPVKSRRRQAPGVSMRSTIAPKNS